MRWNRKKYEVGTRKVERKFAFLPTKLDFPELEVVWLTWYTRDLEYREYGWDNQPYAWIIVRKYG